MSAADIDESVRAGQVDFAVTASLAPETGAPETVADLHFEPMATDVFRLVTALDHPLARANTVPWEALARESFVSFDDANSVRSITDAVFATQGIVPVSRVRARNVATVAGLCAAGLGVSAAPALVLPLMDFAELATTPLTGLDVRRKRPRDPVRPSTGPRQSRARSARGPQ